MSDVSMQVQRMRAQADFLALHRPLLDELGYDKAVEKRKVELKAAAIKQQIADGIPEDETSWFEPNYLGSEESKGMSYVSVYCSYNVQISVTGSPRDQKRIMARLVKEIGGKFRKNVYSETISFNQDVDGVDVEINGDRNAVCKPKTIVKRTRHIPAQPAKEAVPERTEEYEVVEDWDCGSLLSKALEEVA